MEISTGKMKVSIVATSSSTFQCSLAGYRYAFAMLFAVSLAYMGPDLAGLRPAFTTGNQATTQLSTGSGAYFAGFLMMGIVWASLTFLSNQ